MSNKIFCQLGLLAITLQPLVSPGLVAVEGDFDTAFGTNGVITSNLHVANPLDRGSSSVFQEDGRLLTVASVQVGSQTDWAIYRFTGSGAYDTSFSGDGRVRVDFNGYDDQPYGVAVDSQGRILVAGRVRLTNSNFDWAVIRLTSDGRLDADFGTDGRRVLEMGATNDALGALCVDSQDRPLIGGWTYVGGDQRIAIVRLTTEGALDNSFAGNGTFIKNLVASGEPETINGIECDSAGRIVFGGEYNQEGDKNLKGMGYVGRLLANGSLDTDFNGSGIRSFQTTTAMSRMEYGDTRVLDDDSVIWTGLSWFSNEHSKAESLSVFKVTSDGQMDSSFSDDGRASVYFSNKDDHVVFPAGLVALPDGSIMAAAGVIDLSTNNNVNLLGLARLRPNGSLDTDFGGTGQLALELSYRTGTRSLALHEDAGQLRIVCTGSNLASDVMLVAFDAEGQLLDDFGEAGVRAAFSPVPTIDRIDGMRRDAQGRLLCWGQGQNGFEKYPVLARYLTDGRLDTTFGNQGVWTAEDLPGPVRNLAIQEDGRLLLALGSTGFGNDQQALAARLTASGQLDAEFGDGGLVHFADTGSFEAIAVTDDGRVLAAGQLRSLNDTDLLIVAYTATGALDTGFDGDGVWTRDLNTTSASDSDQIKDLLVHDGKLWLAGSTGRGYSDLLLMRTNLQGQEDSDFGQDGVIVANLSKDDRGDALIRLAALPDGRVIGVGTSANTNWQGWMTAALFNESGLDTSFAEDGLQVIDVDPSRQDVAMGVALLSDGFLITGYGDDSKSGTVRSALAARLGFDGSLVASFDGDGKLLFEHPDLRSLGGVVVDGQRAYLAGNNDEDAVLARILLGEVSDEAPPEITNGEQVTVDMDEDGQPTPFALTLNATDADTPASELIWAIGRAAEHGQADVSNDANGGSQVISYLPEVDYYGTDSFTVIVSDGYLTDSIEVEVRIQDQPDEPSGSPEIHITAAGGALADGATLAGPTLITGDSAQTLTLLVHNQGDATLSIDPMQLDQISGVTALVSRQPPNAVAAGNQADIDISLSASAVGSYSLRCRLDNNDDDEGSYIIRIEGQVAVTQPDPRRIRLLLSDDQGPMPIQIDVDRPGVQLLEDEISHQWTITGLDSSSGVSILILEPENS